VQALGDGSVGGQLKSLEVERLWDVYMDTLIAHLKAGRLPKLQEVKLSSSTLHYMGAGPALAWALEARKQRGLPPLIRIEGTMDLRDGDVLRRIWACCPRDKVAYLEASGMQQLEALGQYLFEPEQPTFTALRSLKLESMAGGAVGAGLLVRLAAAVSESKLPSLSSLTVYGTNDPSDEEVRALADGLASPCVRLRHLSLSRIPNVVVGGVDCLAAAFLAEGGGLSGLEELRLLDMEPASILEALAAGAPCAQTLKTLHIRFSVLANPTVHELAQGLRNGAFPRLVKLEVNSGPSGGFSFSTFARSLIDLAASGTPSQLEQLTITGSDIDLSNDITHVVEAGTLPRLTHLSLPWGSLPNGTGLLSRWTALGPQDQTGVAGHGSVQRVRPEFEGAPPQGPRRSHLLPLPPLCVLQQSHQPPRGPCEPCTTVAEAGGTSGAGDKRGGDVAVDRGVEGAQPGIGSAQPGTGGAQPGAGRSHPAARGGRPGAGAAAAGAGWIRGRGGGEKDKNRAREG
jgi:hypothetical protein